MEYQIREFNVQTASDALYEKFFNFYEEILKEMNPDDPLPSREISKKAMTLPHPDFKYYRWLVHSADNNNEIIGYTEFDIYKQGSPSYKENKHSGFGNIFIKKEFRRLGIGTELLTTLINKMRKLNKTLLQGGSHTESGLSFCRKYNGTFALREEESRLKAEDIDWEMLEEWRKQAIKRAKGVKIERFTSVPEEDIEEYCQLYTETLNQVPKGELEWEELITPETRRNQEERRTKLKATWSTIISKEENGVISGLTETLYLPDQPTLLFQLLTSVKKEYRGRGLGKLLKAEMLTYVKELFPNIKFVITDFAIVNDPMIAINRKLGFKKYRIWEEYKFDIGNLWKSLQVQLK
ncbi:MAG: GNAT family N-acetyltransferase [Candidatus Hodarchaeales archaeon]|jgi:RimJ/RimL family protein N-acetyltransferase